MKETPFAKWLRESRWTTKKVAEATGISWAAIRKYKSGYHGAPSYLRAVKVSLVTDGAVTVHALMDPWGKIDLTPRPMEAA